MQREEERYSILSAIFMFRIWFGSCIVGFLVLANSGLAAAADMVPRYLELCAAKTKDLDCGPHQLEFVKIPHTSRVDVLKKVLKIPPCTNPVAGDVWPYMFPPKIRDRKLIARFEYELARLQNRPVTHLLGGRIKKKEPKGWLIDLDEIIDSEEFSQPRIQRKPFFKNVAVVELLKETIEQKKSLKAKLFAKDFKKSDMMLFPPSIQVEVKNGWLLGLDGGAWRGYLVFKNRKGDIQKLLIDNVIKVVKTPEGILAVTGNVGSITNHGFIHKVEPQGDGWKTQLLASLYWRPHIVEQTQSGALLIGHQYASFLFTANGLCRLYPQNDERPLYWAYRQMEEAAEKEKALRRNCKVENGKVNSDCASIDYEMSFIKNYRYDEVAERIRNDMPDCKNVSVKKVYPYNLPPEERDRLLVEKAEEEFKQLSNKSVDSIFKIKPIVKKTKEGWYMGEPEDSSFYKNWQILSDLQDELNRLKFPDQYDFSKDYVRSEMMPFPPEFGYKVPTGWILGADKGEWGGYLVYKSDEGKVEKIIFDTVLRIFKTSFGLYAFSGFMHGMFHGLIYEIKRVKGKWSATKVGNYYALPNTIEKADEDTILLGNQFGSFMFTADGLCRLGLKEE